MNTNGDRENLYELVKDFGVAMLVTHSANGIHARPMAIASLDEVLGAFLVTDVNSLKIDEITIQPNAVLTFQSRSQFASVSGKLTVVQDRQLIDQMWKEAWTVWFPDGKSDPNIALLKFKAHEGEYWDNAGMQGLKFVYDAAKAYVSGDTPKSDREQHAKVSLQ